MGTGSRTFLPAGLWLLAGLLLGGGAWLGVTHLAVQAPPEIERTGSEPIPRKECEAPSSAEAQPPEATVTGSRSELLGRATPCPEPAVVPWAPEVAEPPAPPPDDSFFAAGGFAPATTPWEEIPATGGAYLVREMGDEGRGLALMIQPALYDHLTSTLPICFEEVGVPEGIDLSAFVVTFVLNLEVGDDSLHLVEVTTDEISYSDKALEQCFLTHFEGKEILPKPEGLEGGRRIRLLYKVLLPIEKFIEGRR